MKTLNPSKITKRKKLHTTMSAKNLKVRVKTDSLIIKKIIPLIVVILIFVVGITWAEKTNDKNTKKMVRKWFLKGQAALSFGNYDEAIKCYGKTLELDPNFTDAHRFIGDVYLKKEMLDKAIYEYKKSIAIKPNTVPAHIGLGKIYLQKGMLDKAMSAYKNAIVIYPNSASAHSGLGDVYLKDEKINEGMAEYKRAIAIDPDHASAHFNLGCIYHKQGIASAANLLYKAGTLYFKQGDKEAALKAYENLKRTNSKKLEQKLYKKLYPKKKQKKSKPSK